MMVGSNNKWSSLVCRLKSCTIYLCHFEAQELVLVDRGISDFKTHTICSPFLQKLKFKKTVLLDGGIHTHTHTHTCTHAHTQKNNLGQRRGMSLKIFFIWIFFSLSLILLEFFFPKDFTILPWVHFNFQYLPKDQPILLPVLDTDTDKKNIFSFFKKYFFLFL